MALDPYSELADIIARRATGEGSHVTGIGSLSLSRCTAPTPYHHAAQWPCFGLVVQGAKTLELGAERYRYGVGEYLVVSLDLPVTSKVIEASCDEPFLGLGMAIDPAQLKQVLARVRLSPATVAPDAMRGVAVNLAPPELLDAALRLLRLLDRPQDIPAMAPLLEQEILYRLLTGPFGPRLLQIATAETPSNRIAQAIAWLRGNFMRPLRIEDLADQVGMSVSSLHHHFKAVTAMTPIQFQKQLRLHEARRLMFVEQMDVGTAGYSVGYQSPSQFSREYSRLYGQSPLRDVSAARMQMAAE
ncbi:AraC family transcriptional regulator [Rhodopseudomonas sp. P2A-2r]|uniref:AraC family transcriptional regulator n=1 Tax=Rhodopseudomonas sp. P2A-2r TaxID=2991972 RepID=UPI0022341E86|nr:AraC family transcriptional regulator [Rhodopseudomonas sp. P2A-2r]UZE46672.1 AraC family transcriptional regulator [Rhodopseudomonas sp. P2A-2r]